jgi:hypothetical protein
MLLKDPGAGVAGLVDPVAEAHDPLLAGQGVLDPALGVLGGADLLQELPGFLVGPAVERALERADRRDRPRIDVREGRDRHPPREGRGVQLVLGVEDQREVERRPHGLGGDLPREHVEEIGGVVEVGPRRDRLLARGDAVERGDRGRDLREHPLGLADVGGVVGDRDGQVRVEVPHQAHRGSQHVHRVDALGDLAVDIDEGRSEPALGADPAVERFQFRDGRQFPVEQQIRDFLVPDGPGQVLDGVPAIGQPPPAPLGRGCRRRPSRRR